jgi:hypothetical protein
MIKVIAIGDLHADFPKLWRALKSSYAANEDLSPSDPLKRGTYRVVLIGDLVHPKLLADYQRLTGIEDYDPENPDHLRTAAKAQFRELHRIRRFQEASPDTVTILMGNHDHAALTHSYVLGNATLEHKEFHPEFGGVEFPEDLKTWFSSFVPELNLHGVNFAHVGPVPWLQTYDDMFYNGREAKEWWLQNSDYVKRMNHRFGVYGHTVMQNGILIKDELALIDALDHNQYLEIIIDEEDPTALSWEIMQIPTPTA